MNATALPTSSPARRALGRAVARATASAVNERLEPRRLLANATAYPDYLLGEQPGIGINTDGILDYDAAWTFTDLTKRASDWSANDRGVSAGVEGQERYSQGTIDVDENVFPTRFKVVTDDDGNEFQQYRFSSYIMRDLQGGMPAGTYTVEWQGDGGSLNIRGQSFVQQGKRDDGVTNWGTFELAEGYDGHTQIWLEPFATDAEGLAAYEADPITDIHVWMPDYEGQSFVGQVWEPGADFSPFHPLFLKGLEQFDVIRNMIWLDAMHNTLSSWGERPDVSDFTYNERSDTNNGEVTNLGVPIEYQVQLANDLGKDLWFTMPPLAHSDETMIEEVATYFLENLDPEIKVFHEYGNELWLPSGSNVGFQYIHQTFNTGHFRSQDHWEVQAQVYKEATERFYGVFKAAGQEDRVVRVLAGQSAGDSWQARNTRKWAQLEDYDALAITGYVGLYPLNHVWDETTTAADIIRDVSDSVHSQSMARAFWWDWANDWDVPLLTYEAGQHLWPRNLNQRPWFPAMLEAYAHPDMYQMYQELGLTYQALDAKLFTQFTYTQRPGRSGGWGMFADQRQVDDPTSSPRYNALVDMAEGDLYDTLEPRGYYVELERAAYDEYRPQGVDDFDASAGTYAAVRDGEEFGGTDIGSIRFPFMGKSGEYEFKLGYHDTRMGASRYEFYLDGVLVDEWVADDNLDGTPNIDPESKRTRVIGRLDVENGDKIEIIGYADGGERAPLDWLMYAPVLADGSLGKVGDGGLGVLPDGTPGDGSGEGNAGGGGNGDGGNNSGGGTGDDGVLFREAFDEADGSAAGVDEGGTAWQATAEAGTFRFDVRGGAFTASDTAGPATWRTAGIDISGGPATLSVDVASNGPLEDGGDFADFIEVRAVVDGQLAEARRFDGNLDPTTVTFENLTGTRLVIEVIAEVSAGDETYTFDNVTVTGTPAEDVGVTAVLDGSTVVITGTEDADDIEVTLLSGELVVLVGDEELGRFARAGLTGVLIDALGDDDRVAAIEVKGLPVSVLGGEGDDAVSFTSAGGEVDGGAGNDTINAFESTATLRGGAGDDTIAGRLVLPNTTDNYQVFGGDGNDTIYAEGNGTNAYGEAGNDTIDGGGSYEVVSGSVAEVPGGNVHGGEGDDTLTTGQLATAYGDAGNDTITVLSGSVGEGGDGNDVLTSTRAGYNASVPLGSTLRGGAGDDMLVGDTYPDVFAGGEGTDTVDYTGRDGGNLVYSLDGLANDGDADIQRIVGEADIELGEGDNIADDVEVVLGATLAGGGGGGGGEAGDDLLFGEAFDEAEGSTRGVAEGGVAWAAAKPAGAFRFEVRGDRFVATQTFGDGVWETDPVDISAGTAKASLDLDAFGSLEATGRYADYVLVEAVVDGVVVASERIDGMADARTVSFDGLAGDSLVLRVTANVSAGDEGYAWDNVSVTGTAIDDGGDGGSNGGGDTGGEGEIVFAARFDEDTGSRAGSAEGPQGAAGWTVETDGNAYRAQVVDGRFVASQTRGPATWRTGEVTLGGGTASVSLDVAAAGSLEATGQYADSLVVRAIVDGEVAATQRFDGVIDGGSATVRFDGLTGSTLVVEAVADVSAGDEVYSFDDVVITLAGGDTGGGEGGGDDGDGGGGGDGGNGGGDTGGERVSVFDETFDEPKGSKSGIDANGNRWNSVADAAQLFETNVGLFLANGVTNGFWATFPIDVAGLTGLELTLDVASSGVFTDADGAVDFVEVVARIDDQDVAVQRFEGETAGRQRLSLDLPAGDIFELYIRTATSSGREAYLWDNIQLTGVRA